MREWMQCYNLPGGTPEGGRVRAGTNACVGRTGGRRRHLMKVLSGPPMPSGNSLAPSQGDLVIFIVGGWFRRCISVFVLFLVTNNSTHGRRSGDR